MSAHGKRWMQKEGEQEEEQKGWEKGSCADQENPPDGEDGREGVQILRIAENAGKRPRMGQKCGEDGPEHVSILWIAETAGKRQRMVQKCVA